MVGGRGAALSSTASQGMHLVSPLKLKLRLNLKLRLQTEFRNCA
jgi:hypothetical protein